jgi:hypothetical protein
MTERTYRYAVVEEGNRKYVDVEYAGKVELNDGENAEDRAKALLVSTQQVPEDSIKLEKVDNVQQAIVTSELTPNKRTKKK